MLTRIEVSDMSPENMLKKVSPDDDLQFEAHSKGHVFVGTSKHEKLLDFMKQVCEQWGRVRKFELTVAMECDDE